MYFLENYCATHMYRNCGKLCSCRPISQYRLLLVGHVTTHSSGTSLDMLINFIVSRGVSPTKLIVLYRTCHCY